nr:hypothetical protein CFP56_35005 [Quercus suber]
MRADQFSQSKKFVVEVQGYDKSKSQPSHRDRLSTRRSIAVQSTSLEVAASTVSGGSMEKVGGSEGISESPRFSIDEDSSPHVEELGTWTRISRPHTFFNGKGHPEKDGPKRTTNQAGMEDELSVKEKMLKLDEEARQLGVLLESEFRSVEVVEQPHQVQ